jgi:hypothetical protein
MKELISEGAVGGDAHEYLRTKAHLFSPSCLILIETWVISIHDPDQDNAFLPLSTLESDVDAKLEIPDKVCLPTIS